MKENKISEKVIGCAIEVHRQFGPGLLESVYEEALCYELLSYRRLRDLRLGLLINFNVPRLVDGVYRVVNKLHES